MIECYYRYLMDKCEVKSVQYFMKSDGSTLFPVCKYCSHLFNTRVLDHNNIKKISKDTYIKYAVLK